MKIDMVDISEEKKVKIIKATHMLRIKVGAGGLDEELIGQCQDILDKNEVDFTPMALNYLAELREAMQNIKDRDIFIKDPLQSLTKPVMQLKANAAPFKYDLVGRLATIMLNFLETIKTVDEDVLKIIDAHHKTLSAIIYNKIQGDGGELGREMEDELKAVCARYLAKPQSGP